MKCEQALQLPLLDEKKAEGEAARVLEKARQQVGFVPNMYAAMANVPALLETYLDGYKAFRQHSGFTPAEQEVVFLAISHENGCEYCVAAHSMLAVNMSGLAEAHVEALRCGQTLTDSKLATLADFCRQMVRKRGLADACDINTLLSAGYSERHVLEIVLALAVKTISNYSNHLFHTPLDDAFAANVWQDQRD